MQGDGTLLGTASARLSGSCWFAISFASERKTYVDENGADMPTRGTREHREVKHTRFALQ